MTYPNWYDRDKHECLICGVLLPDTKIDLEDHETDAFHIKKMLEKHFGGVKVEEKREPINVPAVVQEQDFNLIQRPEHILKDARDAAVQLTEILKNKKKPVIMNGEQYLEFEDWQTLARFYGFYVKTGEPELVIIDGISGFKSKAVVVLKNGVEVGSAVAYCMKDEKNWKDKPTFQLASMSQTRAGAKALRNLLAWVAVLAGYKPTPAEEMEGVIVHDSTEKKTPDGGTIITYTEKKVSDKQLKFIESIADKKGLSIEDVMQRAFEDYGVEKLADLTSKQASQLIDALQKG